MYEIDRSRRVSELLKRELARLITRELNDPRIRNVSVNAVSMSKDLKHATVYISSMASLNADTENPEKVERISKAITVEKLLNNASGFLRRQLSQHAELRVTPSLRFKYDDSIQRGVEMSALIDSLNKKHGAK
ncbi:MAG: 30S ribosome-binding factor RbfA [bacterium]